jgi:hypothetical protein
VSTNGHNGSSLQNKERKRSGGPKTPEGKARALANLKPCRPGETHNPAGRPKSAGLSIREWMNEMQEWPRSQIEAVMNDNDAPAAKRAAARCWFDATMKGYTSSGAPVAGSDLDRICDRTDSKPAQPVVVSGNVSHEVRAEPLDMDQLERDLRKLAATDPAERISANGN